MKPEHRHELKTNELAEWLSNLPQWAKENRRTIIYLSILLVLVAALYFYHRYQKNVVQVRKQLELTNLINQIPERKLQIIAAQDRGADISYRLIQTADNLQAVARNTKNNQMAALALIKRGQALRTELHYRLEAANKQDIAAQINRAKTSYTEAIKRLTNENANNPSPSLTATAKFGLGLCEEELGNLARAEQIYRDITANPDSKGTIAAAQATQRLGTMADYKQKVAFKKAPPKPASAAPAPRPIKTEGVPQTPPNSTPARIVNSQ